MMINNNERVTFLPSTESRGFVFPISLGNLFLNKWVKEKNLEP